LQKAEAHKAMFCLLISYSAPNRVHFAFWHKLVYNFKITSSVFKKKLIEIDHNQGFLHHTVDTTTHNLNHKVLLYKVIPHNQHSEK